MTGGGPPLGVAGHGLVVTRRVHGQRCGRIRRAETGFFCCGLARILCGLSEGWLQVRAGVLSGWSIGSCRADLVLCPGYALARLSERRGRVARAAVARGRGGTREVGAEDFARARRGSNRRAWQCQAGAVWSRCLAGDGGLDGARQAAARNAGAGTSATADDDARTG